MSFEYILFGLIVGVPIFIAVRQKWTTTPIDKQRLKCEPPIESRLYSALKRNGYYVVTQYPCGKYRVDLALPTYNIAIECDGKAFHSSREQKAHDRRKDRYLRKNGYKVLRFTGRQINSNLSSVLTTIKDSLLN
jgi:very-short-patch-repair endonuclease